MVPGPLVPEAKSYQMGVRDLMRIDLEVFNHKKVENSSLSLALRDETGGNSWPGSVQRQQNPLISTSFSFHGVFTDCLATSWQNKTLGSQCY